MKRHLVAVILVAFVSLQCTGKSQNPTSSSDSDDHSSESGGTDGEGEFVLPDVFNHFIEAVSITVDANWVTLQSEGVPNYTSPYWGSGHGLYEAPHAGMTVNPNFIETFSLEFRIPLNPEVTSSVTATSFGPVGIAVNGVSLYNQNAAPGDVLANEFPTFDRYLGHPTPTGQYHYHVEPLYITDDGSHLVGFLLDGFPVYGRKDQDGSYPTDLDTANGHTGVTADYPDGIYHYHITETDPYISDGYKGTPGTVTQ